MAKESKENLKEMFNTMSVEDFTSFLKTYHIDDSYGAILPGENDTIRDAPPGKIGVYCSWFEYSNLRLPFSRFYLDVIQYFKGHVSQMNPLGANKITNFEIHCRAFNKAPDLLSFRYFYKVGLNGDWLTVDKRRNAPQCIDWYLSSLKNWKNRFFFVNASVAPIRMRWCSRGDVLTDPEPDKNDLDHELVMNLQTHPIRARSYPERILVLTGLSRNWTRPQARPCLRFEDKALPLLSFLEMKDWEGVVIGSVPIAAGAPSFLTTTLDRVILPSENIPAPYTDAEAKAAAKRKRKSSKKSSKGPPSKKTKQTLKVPPASQASKTKERHASTSAPSPPAKEPSPDTEELFAASEEVGPEEYGLYSETDESSSSSDHTESGEFVFEENPTHSNRSCPATPKGKTESEIEKILVEEGYSQHEGEVDQPLKVSKQKSTASEGAGAGSSGTGPKSDKNLKVPVPSPLKENPEGSKASPVVISSRSSAEAPKTVSSKQPTASTEKTASPFELSKGKSPLIKEKQYAGRKKS